APAGVPEKAHARAVRAPGLGAPEVLHQRGYATEGTVGKPAEARARLVEPAVDDGAELAVEALDPRDRGLDELLGRDLARPDELGLRGRVEHGERVRHGAFSYHHAGRGSTIRALATYIGAEGSGALLPPC